MANNYTLLHFICEVCEDKQYDIRKSFYYLILHVATYIQDTVTKHQYYVDCHTAGLLFDLKG